MSQAKTTYPRAAYRLAWPAGMVVEAAAVDQQDAGTRHVVGIPVQLAGQRVSARPQTTPYRTGPTA